MTSKRHCKFTPVVSGGLSHTFIPLSLPLWFPAMCLVFASHLSIVYACSSTFAGFALQYMCVCLHLSVHRQNHTLFLAEGAAVLSQVLILRIAIFSTSFLMFHLWYSQGRVPSTHGHVTHSALIHYKHIHKLLTPIYTHYLLAVS